LTARCALAPCCRGCPIRAALTPELQVRSIVDEAEALEAADHFANRDRVQALQRRVEALGAKRVEEQALLDKEAEVLAYLPSPACPAVSDRSHQTSLSSRSSTTRGASTTTR